MRHVTFFDTSTGLLHPKSLLVSDDAAVILNIPGGHKPIDHPAGAMLDPLSQRVDVAQLKAGERATSAHIIDYQPPQPSADHEWNVEAKRWRLSAAAQTEANEKAAARARHAHLVANQHDDIRRAVLGDKDAMRRLVAIEDEIANLKL